MNLKKKRQFYRIYLLVLVGIGYLIVISLEKGEKEWEVEHTKDLQHTIDGSQIAGVILDFKTKYGRFPKTLNEISSMKIADNFKFERLASWEYFAPADKKGVEFKILQSRQSKIYYVIRNVKGRWQIAHGYKK